METTSPTARRRILFITQVLPYPLNSGAKVRAYYMLRHLAEQHRVTLCSLVRKTDGAEAVEHLKSFCESVHLARVRRSPLQDIWALGISLASQIPVLIARERSAEFGRIVRRAITTFHPDAIHVDQIKAAPHVEDHRTIPRLIDMHNVYDGMLEGLARLTRSPLRRRLLQREARLMRRYETRICTEFDEVLAVTDLNARRLQAMTARKNPVMSIPICVDPSAVAVVEPQSDMRELLLLGPLAYPPNADAALWMIREILPLIRRERPDIRIRIVGERPGRRLRRAASADPAVSLMGYVDDMSPFWPRTAALAVPLRAGSGMRVKILDAMARGVPVISTPLGAEGIEARNGDEILLADHPPGFARAIARLLDDVDLRRSLSQNARRLVEEQYDWRKRYRDADAVYARLLSHVNRT
ncbi:MAG: glycosyltransferase family 4 protein [Candidatus Sumerlaeia bacterium]|nr:glycosyltransferase family 4 protein [Candidatus Sumerlaeia bacterium]